MSSIEMKLIERRVDKILDFMLLLLQISIFIASRSYSFQLRYQIFIATV